MNELQRMNGVLKEFQALEPLSRAWVLRQLQLPQSGLVPENKKFLPPQGRKYTKGRKYTTKAKIEWARRISESRKRAFVEGRLIKNPNGYGWVRATHPSVTATPTNVVLGISNVTQ